MATGDRIDERAATSLGGVGLVRKFWNIPVHWSRGLESFVEVSWRGRVDTEKAGSEHWGWVRSEGEREAAGRRSHCRAGTWLPQ